jgi:hypothetical protein
MARKTILFELNEVPFRVLDQFCKWQPQSALAKQLPTCFQYDTRTQEISSLSPWITWPSVHRVDAQTTRVALGSNSWTLEECGLRNTEIEDKSGTSAYHIPEGCLFIYDPQDRSVKNERPTISALDIAPVILRNFGTERPEYMTRKSRLTGKI